jgi:hypothetical protein
LARDYQHAVASTTLADSGKAGLRWFVLSTFGARHGRLGYGAFRFLQTFLETLGHKKRRQMCPLYVSGLIGPSDRKSIEPMAERFAPGQYDRLHHFISNELWDAVSLETELARQADRIVGALDAFLVIDDTGLPKKGPLSRGRTAIRSDAGQDGKLPDAGFGDACPRRGSC